MRNRVLYLSVALLLVIFTLSCSNDNYEEFYGDNACDTLNVSFSEVIDPIMTRNCKTCHFQGNGTGVTLVSYEDIKASAENGSLLGSIKHEQGWSPMPQGGKMDDCTISKIEAWVNNGTPND